MNAILLSSPAKLNLFLEVLHRRQDGYHEIRTVMQEIDLVDHVRIWLRQTSTPAPSTDGQSARPPIQLECQWYPRMTPRPKEPPPTGVDNIAFRAAEGAIRAAGTSGATRLKRKDVCVRILKRIPLASGMGGGSSNAATTLKGLDSLLKLGLSRRQLLSLATRLGSDVPFFLNGGTALCTGRGEKVSPLDVPMVLHFVVLVPPWGLSTASVYEEFAVRSSQFGARSEVLPSRGGEAPFDFTQSLPRAERGDRPAEPGNLGTGEAWKRGIGDMARSRPVDSTTRLAAFLAALTRGDLVEIGRAMFNSLETPAFRVEPRMAVLQERMERLEFVRVMMTGSGSAMFGLCRSAAHTAKCARQLRRLRLGSVFVARSTTRTNHGIR